MRRSGITLLELLIVLAVLVIMGAAVVPTLSGLNRDTTLKAAGDLVRQRTANARANAIEQGMPYLVLVSSDGLRIRVTPEDMAAAATLSTEAEGLFPFTAEDEFPKPVQATPIVVPDEMTTMDDSGWIRVATFLPDGTCREDGGGLILQEPDTYPLRVSIRGLTGTVTIAPDTPNTQPGTRP